jgi:hypothetical protein
MPQVISGPMLTAGLRAEFADMYKQTYKGVEARLGRVMQLGIPSDKLTEIYGYFESAPYPRIWRRGDQISDRGFSSRQFTVTNFDWGRRVSWHKNDRADDQTRTLYDQARQAGANWATLPERIFFQLITGAADADLLPAVPNAPDGLALFVNALRFGHANGNVVGGAGVATTAAVQDDFYRAAQRFVLFQDTEGQPLLQPEVLDEGFVVIYGAANHEVFQKAFLQRMIIQNEAAGGNAAPSNIILDSGWKVELWPTQRIADNDWFVFLKGSPKKPIFQQMRQPLEVHEMTMDTSDLAAGTKEEYVQWDSREGYGIALPYGAVQVNN